MIRTNLKRQKNAIVTNYETYQGDISVNMMCTSAFYVVMTLGRQENTLYKCWEKYECLHRQYWFHPFLLVLLLIIFLMFHYNGVMMSINNREAGDLRRRHVHHDVIVKWHYWATMSWRCYLCWWRVGHIYVVESIIIQFASGKYIDTIFHNKKSIKYKPRIDCPVHSKLYGEWYVLQLGYLRWIWEMRWIPHTNGQQRAENVSIWWRHHGQKKSVAKLDPSW